MSLKIWLHIIILKILQYFRNNCCISCCYIFHHLFLFVCAHPLIISFCIFNLYRIDLTLNIDNLHVVACNFVLYICMGRTVTNVERTCGPTRFIVPWISLSSAYPHLHKKIFIFEPIFVKFSRSFINNI